MIANGQSQFPFQAKVTATIKAVFRGPERGVLIQGIFFLIIFLASLKYLPSVLGIIMMCIGLGGLVALLIHWLITCNPKIHEDIPTTVWRSKNEYFVSTPSSDPKVVIPMLREIIQNRKPTPPPHGAVTNGKPQEIECLSEYVDEKRKQVFQEICEGIKHHDQEVIEEMKELEKFVIPEKVELPVQTEIKNKGDTKT